MAELRPLIVPCDCCAHKRAFYTLVRKDGKNEGNYCNPCAIKNLERVQSEERQK